MLFSASCWVSPRVSELPGRLLADGDDEGGVLGLGAVGKFVDEGGLAAAGLAADKGDLSLALQGAFEELFELGQFLLTGDKHGKGHVCLSQTLPPYYHGNAAKSSPYNGRVTL